MSSRSRINIGQYDSLAAIIAAILSAESREVNAVVPPGQESLIDDGALHDLYEETQAGGKIVRIYTDDQHLRSRSRRTGFEVYAAMDVARPPRSVSDIVAPASGQSMPALKPEMPVGVSIHAPPDPSMPPAPSVEPEEDLGEAILDVGRRMPELRIPAFLRSKMALAAALALVGIAVGIGALGVVLPSVEIMVVPRSEELRLTLALKASTNPGQNELAAQLVSESVQLTQEFPVSGRANVSTAASGTVRIYNAYSAESQTLVATTRLVSQDGKLFRTTATVVVPGAAVSGDNITPSSVEVGVIAAEAGPEYNIGPSTFSIPGFQGTPKYTGFYGKSTHAMTGGAKGDVTIATEEDITRAQEGLEAKAAEEIEAKFRAKTPQDLVLLDDAKLRTIVVALNVKAGDATDKVVATADAKEQAILFSGADVAGEATAAIKKRLGENVMILPASLQISYKVSERSFEKGALSLSVDVVARAGRFIDTEALRQSVAGAKEAEIRARLAADENIDFSRVTFSPFFVSRAPKDINRIKVHVEYEPEQ